MNRWKCEDLSEGHFQFLTDGKILSREEMDSFADEIKEFLDQEADWAESQPLPKPEDAAYEIFDNDVVPPAFKKKILEEADVFCSNCVVIWVFCPVY